MGHPATSTKTAAAASRPWAHVTVKEGERDGREPMVMATPFCAWPAWQRWRKGEGETTMDGGDRRDAGTGERRSRLTGVGHVVEIGRAHV